MWPLGIPRSYRDAVPDTRRHQIRSRLPRPPDLLVATSATSSAELRVALST